VDLLDYGAHWIHGVKGNPIKILTDEYQLKTNPTGGDSTYTGGFKNMRFLSVADNEVKLLTPPEKCHGSHKYDDLGNNMSASEEKWRQEKKLDVPRKELIQTGLGEMKNLNKGENLFIQWNLDSEYPDDAAEDPEFLSSLNFDVGAAHFTGGDEVILSGFQSLAERIAKELPNPVKLRHQVSKVSYRKSQVEVTFHDREKKRYIDSRCCDMHSSSGSSSKRNN